jgi:hypothetical protein
MPFIMYLPERTRSVSAEKVALAAWLLARGERRRRGAAGLGV